MRRARFVASLLLAGLLAGSCLGPDGPTEIGRDARAEIAIAPALIPSPADAGARAIHRIRTIARRVSDDTVLGQSTVDVDPAAASWTVSLDVRLPSSPIDVVVTVTLIHVEGGVESVEFSGVAGPLTLTAASAPVQPEVPLVRGPLANFYTTGVTISSSPDTLLEGTTVTLGAAATTSGSQPPTVFWTVLDSAVLSSSGDVVTGLAPGTGRIVASAGAYVDTASIVVRPAPALVLVTPDTVVLAGIGGQASFQAVVIDARGDTIQGEPIVWRSATPSVVTSLGGGLFDAVGTGTGTVEAYGASDATVVGRAVVVVGGTGPARVDVAVLKTVSQPQPLSGDRITFTVSATNQGPAPATNVSVFDTLRRSAFTSPSHSISTGSRVGDSLWIIPLLAQGATATWTTDVTVATGVAGGSASNTAILRALAENDTTPANDTARVSLNFPLSAVPTVQITSPPDSSVFDPGDPVTFVASASDPEDGNLTASIQWRSSIDGALATGSTFTTSTLRAGVHTISASATDTDAGTGADTVRVTIALYTMPSTLNVPFGGTASLPITLSQPAPSGGVTLSVVSSVPTVTNPTASTVFIPAGALSGNATLSGLLPGTANITVSNPQYGAAVVIASVTAELDILGGNVSFATPFTETITVQLESQGVAIAAPGGGLAVTLTSLDPTCVAVASSITIPSGQTTRTASLSYGGSAAPTCQAYVRATSPGVVTDSVLVSVTAPTTIAVSPRTVGAGLQENTTGSLGVANHGGVTLTLTSSDSSVMRVSPNATTAGTRSIDLQIPNGTAGYSFYVQGIEGATGSASVTATAAGFNPGAATMTVVQPGIILVSLPTSTTTLSPDAHFYAYVGWPSGTSVNAQNVRAGGSPVVVTFAVDSSAVGQLTNGTITGDTVTATIPVGFYYTPSSVPAGGVAFDPVGVGTATVTARAPGFIAQPIATQQVTVTAPTITMSARTVAGGLQENTSGSLGATNHGGVTLTLTSSDSTVLRVSPDASTAGTRSIAIQIPDATAGYSFYVQGMEGATGSATVTATATGFNQGAATMTVVQPGVVLVSLPASITTLSPDAHFYAYVGYPSGTSVNAQNVRAGGSPVVVTLAVDNVAIGQLTNGTITGATVTATIPIGLYYTPNSVPAGGVAFDPVGVGTATVTARAPGFIAQPIATQQVTVTAPTITLSARTVAGGLQEGTSGALNATNHGDLTLTLTSSDSTTLVLSPDANTPGTRSISLQIPDGIAGYSFYVQGIEGKTGSATITATANGFLDGTAVMTVVQPGVVLVSLPANLAAGAADTHFYAYVGYPSGNSVNAQNVRAGSPGVVVTATSSNVAAAQVRTQTASGASVTAVILPGFYYTPSTFLTGGFVLDPAAVGQTTVGVSASGFISQPLATQTVTITP